MNNLKKIKTEPEVFDQGLQDRKMVNQENIDEENNIQDLEERQKPVIQKPLTSSLSYSPKFFSEIMKSWTESETQSNNLNKNLTDNRL